LQRQYDAISKTVSQVASAVAKATPPLVRLAIEQERTIQSANKLATANKQYETTVLKKTKATEQDTTATKQNTQAQSGLSIALASTIKQYLGMYALMSGVRKIVNEGMDFNKFVETSTASFGVMMKSVDLAKAKMEELYNFAVESPLTFKETVSASKQLMAYGFAADELVPNMKMLGTVAKATGHSLDDIAYVYGTLRTQGRAYTRDLMQFAMRGIPIYDELAKVMGVPVKNLQKLTEAGKVGFREVEQAFKNMTSNGGKFAGFFEEYMKTFEGKMSMLTDVWQKATGQLTQGLFDELKPVIDDLTKSLSANSEAWKSLGKNIGSAIPIIRNVLGNMKILGDAVAYVGKGMLSDLMQPLEWFIKQAPLVQGAIQGIALALLALIPGWGQIAALSGLLAIVLNTTRANKDANKENEKLIKMGNDIDIQERKRRQGMDSEAKRRIAIKGAWDSQLKVQKMSGDEIVDEVNDMKEMEALMSKLNDKLQSYQDKWDMIQAQKQVKELTDIYAVAKLENQIAIRNIKEEFTVKGKAYTDLMNQALNIQAKLHANEMENIRKEAEERKSGEMQKAADFPLYIKDEKATLSDLTTTQNKYAQAWFKFMDYYNSMWEEGDQTEEFQMSAVRIFDALRSALEAVTEDITNFTYPLIESMYDFSYVLGATKEDIKEWADYYETVLDKMINGFSEFFSNLRAEAGRAYGVGNLLEGASKQALGSLEGTNVGSAISGGEPLAMMVKALMDMLLSIENVNKSLNFMATIMEGAKVLLEPLLNNDLQPFVTALGEIGEVVGNVLAPIFGILGVILNVFVLQFKLTILPIWQLIGKALLWLQDRVIVPFGNIIIKVGNSLIDWVNSWGISWIQIQKMEEMQTSDQLKAQKEAAELLTTNIENLASSVKEVASSIKSTISNVLSAIKSKLQNEVDSLKDLYDVGAISASQLETQAAGVWSKGQADMLNRLNAANITDPKVQAAYLAGIAPDITGGKTLADLYTQLTILTKEQAEISKFEGMITKLSTLAKGTDKAAFDAQFSSINDWLKTAGLSSGTLATLLGTLGAIGFTGQNSNPNAPTTGTGTSTNAPTTGTNAPTYTPPASPPTIFDPSDQRYINWTAWGKEAMANANAAFERAGALDAGPAAAMKNNGKRFEKEAEKWRGLIRGIGGTPEFAVGSSNVPYDMNANVHNGEGIIPSTFMKSIRSGELSLSGPRQSNAKNAIYVTVNGSVTSENDLADTIAKRIDTRRKRGYITA
jgi:hypothetical protein